METGFKGYWQGLTKRVAGNRLLLVLLGVLGVALLVLPTSCEPKLAEPAPAPAAALGYQAQLQRELEQILTGIEGAGRVQVMLTLEDEQELIYAWNEESRERQVLETDGQGGEREQIEYDHRGQLVIVRVSGNEQPVVTRIIKPQVRGVLVVTSGADNPRVRQRLTEAVQGALGVPAYRITIQKGR